MSLIPSASPSCATAMLLSAWLTCWCTTAQAQTAPAVPPASLAASSAAAADAGASLQRGKRLFLRCVACHDASASTTPKTGPHLGGIFGRMAGSVDGYAYSPAMKGQKFAWDEARLQQWLAQPSAVVPGTSMVFIGLPDAAERTALIAYLRTLK